MENIIALKELRLNMEKYATDVKSGKSFIVLKKNQPFFKIVWISHDFLTIFLSCHQDCLIRNDIRNQEAWYTTLFQTKYFTRSTQCQVLIRDFKAILTNIKAAEPDFIFAPSSIATAPLLIKQARELGITAVIAAGDTWENTSIIDNAGADSEGVVLSTFFDEEDAANPVAADFVKGFKAYLNDNPDSKAKNGGDGVAAVSALGYDSYMAAIEAIKAADSIDPVAIRDALTTVTYEGVTGAISFDKNGDAEKDMAYIKVVKDGKFEFLKTVKVD